MRLNHAFIPHMCARQAQSDDGIKLEALHTLSDATPRPPMHAWLHARAHIANHSILWVTASVRSSSEKESGATRLCWGSHMTYTRLCPEGMVSWTARTILSGVRVQPRVEATSIRQIPCLALVDKIHV